MQLKSSAQRGMLGSAKNRANPEDRAMPSIRQNNVIANLPADELSVSLREFLQPVTELLPDVRLRAVAELITQGIVTSQSPIVTRIARGTRFTDKTVWPTCKRAYRFLSNDRFTHRTLYKGLYAVARQTVAAHTPDYLVIAVDPVNMEKPYPDDLEGVSRVMKSTPPSLSGKKRITRERPPRPSFGIGVDVEFNIIRRLRPPVSCKLARESRRSWFVRSEHEFFVLISAHTVSRMRLEDELVKFH
jgi:hypothetical protein